MKILYLTKGDHVDYQNDCLLIGLRELLGSEVVDYNKQAHNYLSYDAQKTSTLYGKGMTVSRVLEDIEIDRTDLTLKIKNKFFDYIVYGSIWRCSDYLDQILNIYPKEKVIAVDGEDETTIHKSFSSGILYFKRELTFENSRVFPISFAFPTSKINLKQQKNRDFSFITPLNRSTYVYTNEKDYYLDYQQSRFGVTTKKAGWDCMRHYEILGNGCIPYFINIEQCPKQTMVHFPKNLCIKINSLIGKQLTNQEIFSNTIQEFEDHFIKHNTTKALATYFVNTINNL